MRTKELATPENNVGPITMLTVPSSTPNAARTISEFGNESKKLPDLSKTVRFELIMRYVCDYLDEYQHVNYIGVYYEIMKTENSDLRDRMIVAFFILHYKDFRSYYLPLADHALTHMQNTECLEMFVFQQHQSRCHI